MKAIKKKLEENGSSPEEVKAFESGAGDYAKKIIANFKDYEFLIGETWIRTAWCCCSTTARTESPPT